jgi:hypothetical protein
LLGRRPIGTPLKITLERVEMQGRR